MRIQRGLKWAAIPLALAGLVALSRTEVVAQVRAALVKNTDEPGRMPLEIRAVFGKDQCYSGCTNFMQIGWSTGGTPWSRWEFQLAAVPAGKKWVVQHVSGTLPGTGMPASVELEETVVNTYGGGKWTYYGPFFTGRYQVLGFNSPAFTVYDAGAIPKLRVAVSDFTTYAGTISVSGYLIDAAN